jgi:glycosyltransferase involved in cell wall biosynthesis
MAHPAVSIIIPTYNRASLLGSAIHSVLNQTFPDFEVIVVDDCSSDDTAITVQGIDDQRVRYIRLDNNKGAAIARNRGIAVARGRYIAFQDSDSEWLPEKLDKQMKVIAGSSSDVVIVYTGCWKVYGDRKTYLPYKRIRAREGNIHESLFWENFLDTPALLVKRECFDKVGMFDERLQRFQDWELCLRLSRHYSFRLIDEPLYLTYYQADSISTNLEAAVNAVATIMDTNISEISSDKKLQAHYYHLLGIGHFEVGNKGIGRTLMLKAVRTNPFNLKYCLSLLLTVLGSGYYRNLLEQYQNIKNRI